MLGSPAATGPGGGGDRAATLWPPTPPSSIYPPPHHHHHQHQHHTTVSSGITTSVGATPLAAPACISSGTNNSSTAEAFSRYGLYSVFPGGAAAAAGAFYSHAAAATAGAYGRSPTASTYYAQHKLISETAGCYSFGAPTPPPGSPYSPLPVTHLELLAKSFNNNSIIIQQTPQDFTSSTLQQQLQQQQQQHITINNSSNNNIINSINSNNNNNNNNNNYNNLKFQKDNNTIIATDKQQRILVDEQPKLKRWMNACSTLSPLSVKTENNCYSPITTINSNNNNCNNNTLKTQRSVCGCRNNSGSPSLQIKNNNKFDNNLSSGGCSRTNPWTPSSGLACSDKQSLVTGIGTGIGGELTGPIHIQVKREPATTPACQVAEITTSNNHTNAIVKIEAPSPNSVKTLSPNITDNTSSSIVQTMSSITTCTTGNGTIPVGIAVARQRLQQELTPTLQPTAGLLTTATGAAQIKEIDSASVAAAAMTVGVATNGGGSIVQCGDDRTNNMTSWPLPSSHGSTLAAPTLWQYPAAPVPMEPMLPVPVPMPPVGFQMVRDPTTGHFFVIPTTSFDQLQQAVVWPSYPQHSSHVLLPPIPPPPLAPLQLLGSTTSDYLTTASTTLHQHTQTHSTRLVALTTDNNNKRKTMPLPSHTLIKIESDCSPSDQQTTKTLQTLQSTMAATNTGCNATTMFTDQSITPLLTTHVFYQHPTNLIQIAQPSVQSTVEAVCRSQATSPVACLTPPPETSIHDVEDSTCLPGVQDASNQTDTPICSEDDSTIQNERDNYYIAPASDQQLQTPLQQMQDLKIPIIVPPTSSIMTPNTPNNDVKIQISTAITTTQITEMRPCIPITIMSQIEPTKPSTKIVEIVEPESSTKETDSTSTTSNTTNNDGGEQVVSTTTTGNTTYSNVDISGLELLSNSIVELENYRKSFDTTPVKIENDLDEEIETNKTEGEYQKTPGEDVVVKKIANMSITDKNNKKGGDSEVRDEQNDDLGGLGLLCALAEQRIMEEVTEKTIPAQPIKFEKHVDIDCKKKLKRCLEERYSLEGCNKKFKVGDFEFERKPQIKSISENDEKLSEKTYDKEVSVKDTVMGEQITKDAPETIKPCCNKSDWSKMNELEKDMRLRLAELQRQCNEKQLELKKLTPQIDVIEQNKKALRKSKSKSLDCDRRSLSPPKLEKEEPILVRTTTDLLKPPVLNTIGHNEKLFSDIIDHRNAEISHKRKLSPSLSEVLSDSTSPFEKLSSSKKRKVGRPKKLSTPDLCEATEMIVAKKPKSLVGYLLAAKSRLHSQSKSCSNSSSPPRYNIEDSPSPKPKSKSHKRSKSISKSDKKKKSSSLNKKRDKHNGSSKVRPKLKAEPKVKLFSDEEENSSSEWSPEDSSRMEEEDDFEEEDKDDTEVDDKNDTEVDNKNDDFDESSNVSADTNELQLKPKDMRCVLTSEHLEIDKLRVLTSMGGLFYAGVLSAIQAPDIYAITLDGERGNRPHIMSREEILRDAILEVSPSTTQELLPGTRLCAYWSQQYRCLYPGTVAEPGTPDPTLDDRFVCVEFDDGDSGRIALEDIRLLQADYPIVEYDPNPLLSLSKRKRRISMNSNVEERRQNIHSTNVSHTDSKTNAEVKIKSDSRNENNISKLKSTKKHRNDKEHKERKKMKKHRRDKLKKLMKNGEEKKRKKKHKCCDEHCKHRRHHKKHRKHRKHHHSNKNKNKINTVNNITIIEDETENDIVEYDEQDTEQNAVQENPSDSYEDENIASEQDDAEQDDNEENDYDDEEEGEVEGEEQDNTEDGGESDNTISEKKSKKVRERQESVESRSKMAAFLPARQLWGWSGKGYKRPGAKGRARKQFFKTIQRGKETISVGDAAVFLSTGRPDRPYIGRIEAMWESLRNSMVVKVKWFYHPEETVGCPLNLQYPGALFESPHVDENDVQTISHKCEVLPLKHYTNKLGSDPQRYETIYDNNDIYYRAGYYDPTTTTLKMEPDIPLAAVE